MKIIGIRLIAKISAEGYPLRSAFTFSINICDDLNQNEKRSLDVKTFDEYKEALDDLFILNDVEAWSPNIRSKTSIRSTPVRHFIDPSLGTSALNIAPEDLILDIQSFGFFFEDLALRDISVYASFLNGEVKHYRDNTGLEVDAVIHLHDGRWAALEIKTGGEDNIEKGAASLKRLERKIIEKSNERRPKFLMVLTAVSNAYRREDGVYVVPLTELRA